MSSKKILDRKKHIRLEEDGERRFLVDQLKGIMMSKGWTRNDVARITNYSLSAISKALSKGKYHQSTILPIIRVLRRLGFTIHFVERKNLLPIGSINRVQEILDITHNGKRLLLEELYALRKKYTRKEIIALIPGQKKKIAIGKYLSNVDVLIELRDKYKVGERILWSKKPHEWRAIMKTKSEAQLTAYFFRM